MTVETWLEQARADAARRGLRALLPLLDTLAAATAELRRAPWNDRADDGAWSDRPDPTKAAPDA